MIFGLDFIGTEKIEFFIFALFQCCFWKSRLKNNDFINEHFNN